MAKTLRSLVSLVLFSAMFAAGHPSLASTNSTISLNFQDIIIPPAVYPQICPTADTSLYATEYGVYLSGGVVVDLGQTFSTTGDPTDPCYNSVNGTNQEYSTLNTGGGIYINFDSTRVQAVSSISVAVTALEYDGIANYSNTPVQLAAEGGTTDTVSSANGSTLTVYANPGGSITSATLTPQDLPGFYDPSWINVSLITIQQGPALDLAVSTPQISQAGATTGSGGQIQVNPGVSVQILVPVSGTGFNSPETRTTTVTLQAGSQIFQSQTVSLAAIKSGAVSSVAFTVTFDPRLVGTTQTITATIAPNNPFNEANFTNNMSSVNVDVTSGTYTLAIALDDTQVYPDGTSGDDETTVTATLTSKTPSPLNGQIINFTSVAKDLSGGHNHTDDRPTGTFDSTSCMTDASGKCQVNYSASQFGGIEQISANLSSDETIKSEADLQVSISNLVPFPSSSSYNLIGSTATHPDNHYLAQGVAPYFVLLANLYKQQFPDNPILQYNDSSLSSGGLFDINDTWNSPHVSHREGHNMDVRANATPTAIPDANIQAFTKLVRKLGGSYLLENVGTPNQHVHVTF
jgi:hypothetical protein